MSSRVRPSVARKVLGRKLSACCGEVEIVSEVGESCLLGRQLCGCSKSFIERHVAWVGFFAESVNDEKVEMSEQVFG